MKKIIFTLGLFACVGQGYAQTSLKEIIRDERSGVSQRFTTLEENQQVAFNAASVKQLLGLDPSSDLVLINKEADELGSIHYRFYQTYKGIPVENSMYIFHTKNGMLTGLSGEIAFDFDAQKSMPATAGISKQGAIDAAMNIVKAKEYMWQDAAMEQRIKNEMSDTKASYIPTVQLVWYNAGDNINPHELRLAYKVDIYAKEPMSRAEYFIDAATGKFKGKKDRINFTDAVGTAATAYSGTQTIHSDLFGASYRLRDYTKGSGIITLHGETGLVGTDYTSVSPNWVLAGTNQAALDAHYGVSQTYSFYRTVLGRNSYNNAGAALYSYVNDPAYIDNAYWNGSSMHFCKRSTGAAGGVTGIDVTGHELTHGVTQSTSALVYSYESGAMNESISDIMGKAVQFWSKPADINWKLSNDMGWFIRDLANPNAYSQPDTYKGTFWYTGALDNGGVHTNSGVGNFMFYLLVNGGSGTNDIGSAYTVTGIGLTAAERIIYRTNAVYLTPNSTYPDWRTACINAATDLFGAVSTQVTQVKNAWYAVGIGAAAGGGYYCASKGTSTTYEYINKVALGTISNTSGNNFGYGNYTWLSTNLTANTTYTISLTPGFPGSTYTEYWTVYIDYNQNGKLNDAGELVASGSGTGLVSIAFKVPKAVLNGTTRMRVQMKYGSSSTDPCATIPSGEVEDYSVNITGGISYCASAGTSTYYEYINNVKLGLINNTSGNNFGYKNYTNLSTSLTDGFSYTISLTPGFAFGPYTEYWNVYIDYNRNGLFTDAGEKVATASGSGLVSASFTIPFLTPTGPTRMRVQMSYGSAPLSPCSAISSGEVEDYSVNILPPVFGPVASTTSSEEVKVTETKTASVMVAPNPVKSANAQVLYTLKENGPATLKFIDLGGRTMQVENLGTKNAGSYTYNVNNLDRLTSGSYVIVIEQNGRIAARNKFIVAK